MVIRGEPVAALHVTHEGWFRYTAHVMDTGNPRSGAHLKARSSKRAIRRAEKWAGYRGLRLVDGGERWNPQTGEVIW